ncbi:GH92 family glycosyl hydrolase [Imperialibacter roseus]|uniref:GH92 family glycosyl hydrolase n=1 Tax=Imperialibacter roseus TaxID=1324217 RepID=A0ABZ0IXY3_9BACT|nr:GH92 family glycosyl hydrolase [Imperialibacter roseus]WOK08815.1 GH92 family glycosyl hydrolase [Imperialibacter roseus]
MRLLLLIPCCLLSFALQAQTTQNPVALVNTLMGTDSKMELSNGNAYPAVAVPWGMNFWIPQTGKMGDGWAYTYDADKIRGFKQTHQPSPWMNDHGQFSLMPGTGAVQFDQDKRASWFSHKAEVAQPHYYSVYLADANITTEITPTERAAIFRLTYPEADSAWLVIDGFDKGSEVTIDKENARITGYTVRNSGGVPANFRNYFIIELDKKVNWSVSDTLKKGHAVGAVGFSTKKGEVVHIKVASSFISPEQATINLKREVGNKSFEQVKAEAETVWNEKLGVVAVGGGSIDQMRTFYSCLYRTLLFPQKMYELDEQGKIVHYSPYNGEVLPGYMFSGTGFWDTFRALYPLLNLLYPSINKEMQEGLINDYKEGGFLPEWSSPGYRNVMVGNNSASVVADAYIKGLRGYDINTLYEALKKDANTEGPMDAVARRGAPYYNKLGYVPYNVGINENAARTLEYAYDDFTIYQLAKALNKPQKEIDLYKKRSQNYRNLFDNETKLMRGKNEDGSFQSPFNPLKWGDAFTEGNSWHYTWSVFHDIEGLKQLMGGDKMFISMLDSVFSMPPLFDDSYYGFTIHEIREMQIMNMGQYAHGNQPIQHMTYLYNFTSEPWKAQYWIREVMNKLYTPAPDGYCGDEDNGQTSAWYVFSAIGFYPVCPGTDQYVLGAPLFKEVMISLENGKNIEILAPENNHANFYVNEVVYNGSVYDKNWLAHSGLVKGAKISFDMTSKPNTKRGVSAVNWPFSMTFDKK